MVNATLTENGTQTRSGRSPSVELRGVSKFFGEFRAVNDISLAVEPGEFLTLLGPSGCGKTTTLRMIGGFEYPSAGSLLIHGEEMGSRPPYKRPVNTVFQNYALFPHLSVGRNIEYGLEMAKVPKDERKRRVAEALEMVRLPHVEKRRPSELSGGQQQRVGLARALVNRPEVLLLDEPLGALDLKLRKAMQLELKSLNREVGVTFIYVTHDQEEALTMSDRIAVMSEGRILQIGAPTEIYERPRSRFVADFIGQTNFIEGAVRTISDGVAELDVAGSGSIRGGVPAGVAPSGAVTAAVRPERVLLATDPEARADGAWNRLSGAAQDVIYLGTHSQIVVGLPNGKTITVHRQNRSAADLTHAAGEAVEVVFGVADTTILID
jgi:spermidine/putrescine transport system ATP-binding protein